MLKKIPITLALCAFALPGFAQKVTVDWDKDYDFTAIGTYEWAEPEQTPQNPLMRQRVEEAIQYNLAMLGVERVESGGDVVVTYHSSATDEVVIHSDHFGFGYGRGWGRWGVGGVGSTTSRSTTYTKATMIVDMWDAESKNMVFRGTISDTVSDKPEKNEKKINKGAEKLFGEFEKKWTKAQKK